MFIFFKDEEAEKIKAARVQAYSEKKSKKPALIAKSSIVLDVKPWDDETDMKEMEKAVRAIVMDGLIWGACKLYCVLCLKKKLLIMPFLCSQIRACRLWNPEAANYLCRWRWKSLNWSAHGNHSRIWRLCPVRWHCCLQQNLNCFYRYYLIKGPKIFPSTSMS